MRIVENRTTYHCGYCKEYYLVKSAAEKHEQFCRNNPANRHQCWGCDHLKKSKEDLDSNYSPLMVTTFECTALNKYMYSYIAERRGMVQQLEMDFDDIERMPLECPSYSFNPGF